MSNYSFAGELAAREFEILPDGIIERVYFFPGCNQYWQSEVSGDMFSFRNYHAMRYAMRFLRRACPHLVVSEEKSALFYLVSVNP